ncbi:hypothetical protein KSP40_PGU018237 [Platanthera guangdongensis]|uniref:Uncharacterized protein n=1 Tax=Platanthera guangdongensis TaxID=2320717 RepID=A0ABR2MQ34_9ASPA
MDALKAEIFQMFMNREGHLQSLELIDTIQRLGVAYHFEMEISEALQSIYVSDYDYHDLYAVSLHFRLLRQQRYLVPTNVFEIFLDKNGNFKNCLSTDANGLLSLFEAAHLGMPEEKILDDAIIFSKTHLMSLKYQMEPHFAAMLSSALQVPLFRRIDRSKTRSFLSIYEEDNNCNKVLLDFAKMDFLCLQALHQDEAKELSIWWKKLEMSKKLPFARDRLVECYFWIVSVYFESHYSRARTMMTKFLTQLSILDDIYDVYGTLEELYLLTDVIEQLIKMAKDYLIESIWANKYYVPKLDEHLSVTIFTAGYSFLTCAAYIGMEEMIPKTIFDWVAGFPEIIKASCLIGRILNDIVSYKLEQKRIHVASVVQCYLMEHECSEEEACLKLLEMSNKAWKNINKEFLMLNKLPLSLIGPIMNLARFNEFVYLGKDMYTQSEVIMKEYINAVLVEPIQINGLRD